MRKRVTCNDAKFVRHKNLGCLPQKIFFPLLRNVTLFFLSEPTITIKALCLKLVHLILQASTSTTVAGRCREPYLHHGGQTTAKYYRVGSTLRREKITHFSLPEGFAQNIIQLESSYETNKRKRKRDDGDNYDYIYGIVSTTRDWHFLLYNPGRISQGSKLPLSIEFSEDALDKKSVEYQTLCNGVKKVLSVVVGIIKDRACAEEEPDRKRAREEYCDPDLRNKLSVFDAEIAELTPRF
ncbi:hypothetical protein RclHR1_06570012 [Rhizophagus clarus]|uniref:Uncharacterized protein n=1 Tax=Rhizophagus clarus TaxID=94130 RepID=A0A2Z6RSA9_9GLOM|nr:hypothetical protein RclHR1_06570012 [Rhizophagus clarus]